MSDFFTGLTTFFTAVKLLFVNREVFKWFRRITIVAFVIALAVLFVVAALGLWLTSVYGWNWWSALGAVLWILALFYFSGTLCFAIMSIVVGIWGQEERLMKAIYPSLILPIKKASWKDLRSEFSGAIVSALVAVLSLPLVFLSPLLPLAVFLMSWAFGREAFLSSSRVLRQCNMTSRYSENTPSVMFYVGISIVPVLLTFIPVLGWMMWPLLLLAAIVASNELMRIHPNE